MRRPAYEPGPHPSNDGIAKSFLPMEEAWEDPIDAQPIPRLEASKDEPPQSTGITLCKLLLGGLAAFILSKSAKSQSADSATATFASSPHEVSTAEKVVKYGALAAGTGVIAYKGLEKLYQLLPEAPMGPVPLQIPPAAVDLAILPAAAKASTEPSNAPGSVSDYALPPDAKWLDIVTHPSVGAIIGMRDSGKSTLAFRLAELYRDRAAPYVVGMPEQAHKYLPPWMGVADAIENVPPGSFALIDEAYLHFHARSSMSDAGRSIGALINLSRQKRLSLVFVVQEARQLDINVISQLDWLAIKELTDLSSGFERAGLRRFTDKARAEFSTIRGSRQPWTWVHSEKGKFEGLVKNIKPSFWGDALSHAYAGEAVASESRPKAIKHKRGTRTPMEELEPRAKAMHDAKEPYRRIAKTLGVSVSTAYKLVNG